MALSMIIAEHKESYLNFIATLHHLNIPREHWNIIFNPSPLISQLGNRRLGIAKKSGFTSMYFTTPNPLLLERKPFEEIDISDTDSEEEVPLPPSSAYLADTPSSSLMST